MPASTGPRAVGTSRSALTIGPDPRSGGRIGRYCGNILGAHLLEAVSPKERRGLVSHLETWATCRAAFAALRAAVRFLPLALEDREPPATAHDPARAAVLHGPDGGEQPRASISAPSAWPR